MTGFAAPCFPSPADWRDVTIYQIFTDRFADGEPSNNELTPGVKHEPSNSRGVHGGDFAGVERHLEYIHGLGARAIWITPVFLNEASSAWHGYGVIDFTTVSPQLGGLKGLQSLIRAAHRRGIYVFIDVVVNHTGYVITSDEPGWPRYRSTGEGYHLRWRDPKCMPPPPFNNLNWYHDRGRIEKWEDPVQAVVGQFYTLSDLRTELPEVRAALIDVYRKFIGETDCDGFRVDTVRHVERSFWEPWCSAIREGAAALGKTNFLMFGEAADGSDEKIAIYTGPQGRKERAFDSLLDFPFYFAVKNVVALANAPTRRLTERWKKLTAPPYSREAVSQLVTFIDNHDQPRFLAKENADGDDARLRQALVLLYTGSGIPCLYYGTEQGFRGGHDPYNREDMVVGQGGRGTVNHFDPDHPLYRFIAQLNHIRREHPALRQGSQLVIADNERGPGLFAFVRRSENDAVLVILNTASNAETLSQIQVFGLGHTVFHSLLGETSPRRIEPKGKLSGFTIPPKAAWVFEAARE